MSNYNKIATEARKCIKCGISIFKKKNESVKYFSNKKYCSRSCHAKGKIGIPSWNKGKKLHYSVWNKGTKGLQVSWLKGRTGVTNSGSFKIGHKFTDEVKEKISKSLLGRPTKYRGSIHRCWRGGITPLNKKIRQSIEYKEWRRAVYERDDYTCQDCGIRGTELNADHIKPFSLYPDLRFELSNGRTLCIDCHRKTDTYGNKLQYRLQGACAPSTN